MIDQCWCLWQNSEGYEEIIHHSDGGRNCRRVVVIDPEDDETLRKFAAWTADGDYAEWRLDWVREFLRSLVAPPKPDEPTDPAACVTDRRENIWRLLADGDWVCTSGPDVGEYLNWDQLAGDRGPVTVTTC